MVTRRGFLASVTAISASRIPLPFPLRASGRFLSRPPEKRTGQFAETGLTTFDFATASRGAVYIPPSYRPDKPIGVILGLHGATQRSDTTLRILQGAAEKHQSILLAPNSRDVSWDLIRSDFGEDELFMDRALAWAFARCTVDPARIMIAGFSDGASASLSLGLVNGDLFRHVVAFSPGFIVGTERHGKPSIFVSHGTRDQILPIDQTSEQLVPALRKQGYAVEYRKFDGPHWAPPEMVEAAMVWAGGS